MKVFTYGTLMKGFHNHSVMEYVKGKFVGFAKMSGKIMYYVNDIGNFPAIVDGEGDVYGEVYEVPNEIKTYDKKKIKTISVLDNLEGYEESRAKKNNMYLRKEGKVVLKGSKVAVVVTYYYWNEDVQPRLFIKCGDYRKQENKRCL